MATEELTSDRDLARPLATPPASSQPASGPLSDPGEPALSAALEAESPPSSTPPDDPLIGAVIAERYRLIERVGEGGMGAVYRGEHVALRKRVAVKFLHAEMSRIADVVARFEREAVAAANLEHPNIVAAHDFGKTKDGTFFLVMEYVDGGSLRDLLDKEGRLQPARVAHIARQIAAALQRAHALEIVHRDLKPENVVLVEREGDRDFAKVIDFGIAKVPLGRLSGGGQALTQAGMVFGTPDYMAPEQALGGKVDHRADLYAFGVMVFEMLTGQRPFESDDVMALLGKHMTQPPPAASATAPPGVLSAAVDQVFDKALAKSPGARFDSAAEFVKALDAALGIAYVPSGGTYPPGFLAPVPASIGTPPYGVVAPPPAVVKGPVATVPPGSSASVPGDIATRSPAAAEVARETLDTLVSGYADLRKDPARHKRVVIVAASIGVLVLVFAIATRPRHTTHVASNTNGTPSGTHVTPTVPPSILRAGSNTTPPPATADTPPAPVTTAATPNPPSPTATGTGDAPARGASLADQLAEYQNRPNVRVLLDAARGRQLRMVITAFEQTRAQAPDDPIVNYLLGTLYARDRGRTALAVERYGDAVRLAPDFARDPTLLRDVVNAFASQRRPVPQATALLGGPLSGTVGPYLLDAFMNARRPPTRARLLAALNAAPFNALADPTARGLIELSSARTCEEKLPIVQQLGREGDDRALPYLRRIQVSPRGCGVFGFGPCNPCLSEAMPQALAAIGRRPAPGALRPL